MTVLSFIKKKFVNSFKNFVLESHKKAQDVKKNVSNVLNIKAAGMSFAGIKGKAERTIRACPAATHHQGNQVLF